MRTEEEIKKKLVELEEDKKNGSFGTNHGATRYGQIEALNWVLNNKSLLLPGI